MNGRIERLESDRPNKMLLRYNTRIFNIEVTAKNGRSDQNLYDYS